MAGGTRLVARTKLRRSGRHQHQVPPAARTPEKVLRYCSALLCSNTCPGWCALFIVLQTMDFCIYAVPMLIYNNLTSVNHLSKYD